VVRGGPRSMKAQVNRLKGVGGRTSERKDTSVTLAIRDTEINKYRHFQLESYIFLVINFVNFIHTFCLYTFESRTDYYSILKQFFAKAGNAILHYQYY